MAKPLQKTSLRFFLTKKRANRNMQMCQPMSQLEDMPPLVDFLLNPDKYPAVEVEPKPKKRGRPRRFEACPECGAEGFSVIRTTKAGHCVNLYCECPACGKLRFVSTGEKGHWVRVRSL